MINLIVGHKGSGKTKKLVEEATAAEARSQGNVVVIEKGPTLTYSLTHRARLIDIEHYGINGYDELFGFVAGICAGNYDVTDIFVDATLRIGGRDYQAFADFADRISALSEESNTNFTFTVSCDKADLPEQIFEVAQL